MSEHVRVCQHIRLVKQTLNELSIIRVIKGETIGPTSLGIWVCLGRIIQSEGAYCGHESLVAKSQFIIKLVLSDL